MKQFIYISVILRVKLFHPGLFYIITFYLNFKYPDQLSLSLSRIQNMTNM